jgi:hypothetical protein
MTPIKIAVAITAPAIMMPAVASSSSLDEEDDDDDEELELGQRDESPDDPAVHSTLPKPVQPEEMETVATSSRATTRFMLAMTSNGRTNAQLCMPALRAAFSVRSSTLPN